VPPRATTRTNVPGWSAHGWNIDLCRRRIAGSQYGRSSLERLTWNAAAGMSGTCTLLGPEGSEPAFGPGRNLRTSTCLSFGEIARGTARTLRTTQWTRAS
jgi:hypothetical protein